MTDQNNTINIISGEENEKQFRNLVMQSPVAMAIVRGENLVIEMANKVLLRSIWHRELSEVEGKALLEIFPELRQQAYPALLRQVLHTGTPHSETEAIAFVNDGKSLQRFYLDYEYAPLFNSDNAVTGVIITVNDVTEKVIYRQKLEEAEQRSRLAIEAAELGTFDWNMDTGIFAHSQRLVNIFGFNVPADSLTREELRERILPEDMPIRDAAIQQASKGGAFTYEVRLLWPGGIIRWVRVKGTVVCNEKGEAFRAYGAAMDITEQMESVIELEESEKRFRLLANTAPVMIWTSGTDMLCDFFNRQWLSFRGRTMEQEKGNGWTEGVHADDLAACFNAYVTSFNKREDFYLEYRLMRHDGVYRWISDSGAPRYMPDGTFVGYVGSCMDIHEQKAIGEELEKRVIARTEELLQSNTRLEQTNQELEQYAYVASHDLQEPLRKIKTYAGMLYDGQEENTLPANIIRKIMSATTRMSNLIYDLLNFSRLLYPEKTWEPVDLNGILQEVLNDFELSIQQKAAVITIGSLPTIEGTPLQMNQLFYNLVNNALKFIKKEVAPQIVITAIPLSKEALEQRPYLHAGISYTDITVSDNGIGFNTESAQQIFEVFKRLHNNSVYPGSGIGLALCKRIVTNHKGDIYAESSEGAGAIFHIILPLQQTNG